jgi:nucleotide-binding universal stress UspA family protein
MKFVVCFDASPQSTKTLEVAQAHAKVWNADLLVVQAINRQEPLTHKRVQIIEEELAENVAGILKDSPHETVVLVDSLERGEQIVKFARRQKVDQVFLGIEKKSKVSKLLFGSTAQFVILRSPCPVVTVT